jgi:hypothetical protein
VIRTLLMLRMMGTTKRMGRIASKTTTGSVTRPKRMMMTTK